MAGEYLPPVVARLTGDVDGLVAAVARAKAALDSLKASSGDVKVGFDVSTASMARATAATEAYSAATNRSYNSGRRWTRWLATAHNILTIFGANIIADTIGIIAFGIGAVGAFAPVIETIKNLGANYSSLNNYQKAATVSLTSFAAQFGRIANPGIYAVVTAGMDLIGTSIGRSGGIMDQATVAFENFISMLRVSFSSSAWQQMFNRGDAVIQKDLTALFALINGLINVIPALFHDFNGLGLWVLSSATAFLHLVAVLGDANPSLMRFAAVTFLVYRALKMLGQFNNGSLLTKALAPMAANMVDLTGVMQNFRMFGLLPTIGMMAAAAPVATAFVATLAVVGGGLLALALISRGAVNPMQKVIATMAQQDNATGLNIAGYEKLSHDLGVYAQQNDLVSSSMRVTGNAALMQGDRINMVSQAQQRAAQTAQTLRTNLGYLENTYHLTQSQAIQLAQATGVNLYQGFTKGGGAAQATRLKIQAYEQTVNAARNPTTELAYDLGLAGNQALDLSKRVQALTNAFNALLTPFANTLQDTVTWSQGNRTLRSDVQKVHGDVNAFGGRLKQLAAQDLAQAITNTVNLSQATLQQSGSMRKAIAPVRAEINILEGLHSKSAVVAQAIKTLQAYIDQLHSKTITIQTNFVTTGAWAGGNPFQPGGSFSPGHHASGTPNAPAGWSWVGEQGPELMWLRGGERIASNPQSMAMAGAAGGSEVVEKQPIVIMLDGHPIYEAVRQTVYYKNTQNGVRSKNGSVQGRFGIR